MLMSLYSDKGVVVINDRFLGPSFLWMSSSKPTQPSNSNKNANLNDFQLKSNT